MIVSGESKTSATGQGRARSRRRVGDLDAVQHHAIRGMTSAPIVVEDEDDDDLVVSSPTAFAQVREKQGIERRFVCACSIVCSIPVRFVDLMHPVELTLL
jgi:hypothetical protein